MSYHMHVYSCPMNYKPFWIATVHTEDGIFTHGGPTASMAAAMLLDVLGAKYHVTSVDQDLKLEKMAGVAVGVKPEPMPAFVSPEKFYPPPPKAQRERYRNELMSRWQKKMPGASDEAIQKAIRDHSKALRQKSKVAAYKARMRRQMLERRAEKEMAKLAKQRGEAA